MELFGIKNKIKQTLRYNICNYCGVKEVEGKGDKFTIHTQLCTDCDRLVDHDMHIAFNNKVITREEFILIRDHELRKLKKARLIRESKEKKQLRLKMEKLLEEAKNDK